MMQLSSAGALFIQGFELCRLTAYPDSGGIWTIGWGHTPAHEGQVCTPAEALAWFSADVEGACRAISETVTVSLSQNQFDALVSFTFNVGVGSEAHSTLLRLLNAGDYAGAADQFLIWNHVNGVVNAGLTRRRQAEQQLFLS